MIIPEFQNERKTVSRPRQGDILVAGRILIVTAMESDMPYVCLYYDQLPILALKIFLLHCVRKLNI